MKGYPKVIATKADFENLLAEPEFRVRAVADLTAVADLDDDTMERVVNFALDEAGKMINIIKETVPAPLPRWKRLGFASRQEAVDLCASNAPVVEKTTEKGGA